MTDPVYYNIHFANLTSIPLPARAVEQRSSPFLEKPNDYYVDVERFSINAKSIPLMIIPSSGLGSYLTVSFWWGNVGNGTVNLNTLFPTSIYLNDNYLNKIYPYNGYVVYTYNQILWMINQAIASLWRGELNYPDAIPFILFNSATNKFDFYMPQALIKGNANIYLEFSPALAALFDYVPFSEKLGNDSPTNQIDAGTRYYAPPFYSTNTYTDPKTNKEMIINSTENDPRWQWNNLERIVFTSNLPIAQDLTQCPTCPISNTSSPILTDFDLPKDVDFRSGNIVQYYPQGPVRYVDVIGTFPLSFLEVSVSWEDKYGNIFPIYILPGDNFNLKLKFVKKNLVVF